MTRTEEEIQKKLDELQQDASNHVDTAELAQIRALRWVLKETASL